MKSKKGISLIILVVTIIVLAIIISAVTLNLGGENIKGIVKENVNKMDLDQIEKIATSGWVKAYAEGARTVEALREGVMEALEKNNIDVTKYNITVTTNRVIVEVI